MKNWWYVRSQAIILRITVIWRSNFDNIYEKCPNVKRPNLTAFTFLNCFHQKHYFEESSSLLRMFGSFTYVWVFYVCLGLLRLFGSFTYVWVFYVCLGRVSETDDMSFVILPSCSPLSHSNKSKFNSIGKLSTFGSCQFFCQFNSKTYLKFEFLFTICFKDSCPICLKIVNFFWLLKLYYILYAELPIVCVFSSLCLSLSVSLYLSLSVCLCLSLSLSVCLFLSLSLCLSLTLSLSHSLSLPLSLSLLMCPLASMLDMSSLSFFLSFFVRLSRWNVMSSPQFEWMNPNSNHNDNDGLRIKWKKTL